MGPPSEPSTDSDEEDRRRSKKNGRRRARKSRKSSRSSRKASRSKRSSEPSFTTDVESDTSSDTSGDYSAARAKKKTQRGLTPICPVNPMYADVLDYRTYRLNDRSKRYDHKVAGKISKWISRMRVQLGSKQFDPADPVSILSYLQTFKTACDTLGVNEGAAVWLFAAYMREPAKSALTMRIVGSGKRASSSRSVAHVL